MAIKLVVAMIRGQETGKMPAVVGLGGSAGSIGALQKFFSRMPADSGLAFVVVCICRQNTKAF